MQHMHRLFIFWRNNLPYQQFVCYVIHHSTRKINRNLLPYIHPPDVICSRFNSQCLWLNFWIKKSILLTLPFLSSNFFGLVKFGILIFSAIFSSLIDDHFIFDVFELFWLNDIQSKLQQKIWHGTEYKPLTELFPPFTHSFGPYLFSFLFRVSISRLLLTKPQASNKRPKIGCQFKMHSSD